MTARTDKRRQASLLPLIAGLGGLGTLIVVLNARTGSPDFALGSAVGLTAAFFITRLLTIRLPQGDEVYVVAVVGVSALAVANIGLVLLASLGAGVIELMARWSQSSESSTRDRALDVIRGTVVLGMLAPTQPILQMLIRTGQSGDRLVATVLVVGCIYSLLDVLSIALQQSVTGRRPLSQSLASLQRPLVIMYLVHLSMAAVGVQLYAVSGAWAFPIALLLTLILQNSFNLYLRIRRGYGETIGALAHAAELDRPHDSGHAKRVSDLSVAVGRWMGLSSSELERIGYAALLHDIGRMGDSRAGSDALSAERGAAIVASIPFLSDVAPLISGQMTCDDQSPIGSQVVRLCSRYDRLRSELSAAAALDALGTAEGNSAASVLAAMAAVIGGQQERAGWSQ